MRKRRGRRDGFNRLNNFYITIYKTSLLFLSRDFIQGDVADNYIRCISTSGRKKELVEKAFFADELGFNIID